MSCFARFTKFSLICLLSIFLPYLLIAEDKIKIGVSVALTGNAATYGVDIKNSLVFANQHLTGGKYELIIEDDMCDGKRAVNIARKFVEVDQVKYVLGFACSSALLASANIYESNKVLAIASSAAAGEISNAGDYIFRTVGSNDELTNVLYSYMVKRHKRIGIISEQTDFPQGLLKSFLSKNNEQQVPIFAENYLTNELDYRSLLLRLKAKNVDAIFINSQSEATFILALKALKEMRLPVKVYGAYMPGSETFLKNAGSMAEGIIFVDRPSVKDAFTAEGVKILSEFKKQFKLNGWEIMFAASYEAFRALDVAINSGIDPKKYLYEHNFSGIFGNYSFDRSGDIKGVGFLIKEISEGQIKNLS